MASPENTPMKMQWITVEGRNVPIVLPQVWNDSKQEWDITSEKDPLPTVDYGTTENGILIPKRVSNDGAQLTQVTGSNVEYVGYSTDSKPAAVKGDSFMELDSKDIYFFDGNDWVVF